ncbi:unnamed protein product [Rotaria sp. Silwood2]|nr:unnamed protein product [Rotaria sp. Silwood2]
MSTSSSSRLYSAPRRKILPTVLNFMDNSRMISNTNAKYNKSSTDIFDLLRQAISERRRIEVLTRDCRGIYGILIGWLIVFDKHMNLIMSDVDEVFRRLTDGHDYLELGSKKQNIPSTDISISKTPEITNDFQTFRAQLANFLRNKKKQPIIAKPPQRSFIDEDQEDDDEYQQSCECHPEQFLSMELLSINNLTVQRLSNKTKHVDTSSSQTSTILPTSKRAKWTLPSILQWYRSINNYSIPIASQFNDYPVHIDDSYINRYSLLSNGSLKIENIQLNDNDTFECRLILIDRGLLDIKEKYFITLRVNEKPRFINLSNPIQTVAPYSTVNLLCQIYGVPNPTVTWYKVIQRSEQTVDYEDLRLLLVNSQELKNEISISDTISSQDRIRTFSDGILNINNIEPSDHGSYVCKISIFNSTSIRSKPAFITVKYPPIPSRNRQTNNLTLIQGSLGICPCLLDAYPPIQSVSWYRNGRPIRIEPKGGAYTINSEYALVIKSIERNDNGEYFCRAQNPEGFGHDSIPFDVIVKEPIQFISKPDSIYYVHENDRLILPCVVFGNPQPRIKWLKNSIELNEIDENLTLEYIEKSDHGLYICQASNEYTTINISTLIIVENTTPQAPLNVRYEQISTNILLSWEPGYDGTQTQHFIIWYRMIKTKKGHWNQIRVLPNNATEFLVFDLELQQTYEITIVGENDIGLGTFSSIISVYLNDNQDSSIGYFYYSNETNFLRPLSPIDLHLSYSTSNLYITWNHPDIYDSLGKIFYYIIQWRSSIVFNNQQSQQSIVIQYPSRSYILKSIKQSKYIIQIMSYSSEGLYSIPIESEINIQFNSILAYHGSHHLLISLFCFLTVLTFATLCICVFFLLKYYFNQRSFPKDLETDLKLTCWCFPSIQSRLNDSSSEETDRYHTNLLKSNDIQNSPIYSSQHHVTTQTIANSIRSPSPSDSVNDSSLTLAKVSTVPRCRDSILSNTLATPQLTHQFLSTDNSNAVVSPSLTFAAVSIANDDIKMKSFFQPISLDNASPIAYSDIETRKNSSRLPLEAVPELSELNVANSRYSITQSLSSTNHIFHHSHSVQPSPVLITFDSSSLKRRS